MEKMIKRGFLLNIGVFPAVSKNHSGIRFTITTLQSFDQIERMVKTLNEVFFEILGEHQYSVDQIYSAFKVVARLEDRPAGECPVMNFWNYSENIRFAIQQALRPSHRPTLKCS
ncbi:hypothetical protein D3C76_1463100 [compost metagenome]